MIAQQISPRAFSLCLSHPRIKRLQLLLPPKDNAFNQSIHLFAYLPGRNSARILSFDFRDSLFSEVDVASNWTEPTPSRLRWRLFCISRLRQGTKTAHLPRRGRNVRCNEGLVRCTPRLPQSPIYLSLKMVEGLLRGPLARRRRPHHSTPPQCSQSVDTQPRWRSLCFRLESGCNDPSAVLPPQSDPEHLKHFVNPLLALAPGNTVLVRQPSHTVNNLPLQFDQFPKPAVEPAAERIWPLGLASPPNGLEFRIATLPC